MIDPTEVAAYLAGATVLVAGSAVFNAEQTVKVALEKIRASLG